MISAPYTRVSPHRDKGLADAHLLTDHIHRILNATVWDYGEDRSIDDPQLLRAMDFQVGINNALLDRLGETTGATRI